MADETEILLALDVAVHTPRAAVILATIADEVRAELACRPDALLAWRTVPLSIYDHLPDGIASNWVFVLRAGCTSGAERHPNSIQRFMSWRGSADMQTWSRTGWLSNHLVSDAHAPLDRRWLSIPLSVWHRPVMGAGDWVVVSFHTAPDDQLIEERPADDENPDAGLLSSKPYEGRKAR